MIINALLKKTIKTPTIKAYKKKHTITLIPLLNLPFNPIKFKSVKIYIIIIKNPKKNGFNRLNQK